MIRDKLVTHALRQAHQSVLEPGRHPAYLLYLEIDPQQVDINVHPTKHEVRFRESRLVHDFLLQALLRAFNDKGEALPLEQRPRQGAEKAHSYQGRTPEPARVAEQTAFYRQSLTPAARPATRPAPRQPEQASTATRLLAVAPGGYLLLQRAGEFGIMAVAGARQLLLARRLEECLSNGEVPSQPLLIPATVTMAAKQIEILEQHATTLLRLGVVVEQLGEASMVLRQLPTLLRGVEAEAFMNELKPFLLDAPDPDAERRGFVELFAARMAPQLPVPDMAAAEGLLRELEQLLSDGLLGEQELPWVVLTEERLQGLFSARH
jgi:DNA mismatch repair protein MutL